MIAPITDAAPQLRTVLVVEDEMVIRWLIADTLREAGYTVVEASNADEALLHIRSNPVDFVFSDVRMPGSIDGAELARKLRAEFPALPLLLTSGHLSRQDLDPEISLIGKPYRLAEVLEIVAGAIGKGEKKQETSTTDE